jgi:hypothetical protein
MSPKKVLLDCSGIGSAEFGRVQIVFCKTMSKSKPPNGLARVFDAAEVRKRSRGEVKAEQLLVLAARGRKALLVPFGNVVVVPILVGH